jgi:hypothetical protein
MTPDPVIVEIMAKAAYEHTVKQASAAIDAFSIEHGSIVDLVAKLLTESETAQVLIFYSYLDDAIERLMRLHMHDVSSETARDAVFGFNSPLGSFGARVAMAFHLGWITSKHKVRLTAFRKVRNEFAHRAFKTSIGDPLVASQLKLIDYDIEKMLEPHKDVLAEQYDMRKENILLSRLIMLASQTFVELLTLPVARGFRIHLGSITGSFDNSPELIKNVRRSMSRALLAVGDKRGGRD